MTEDVVNSPKHYLKFKMEVLEIMYNSTTKEEFLGYLKCNIMKYILRYQDKGGAEDLEKAKVYLNRMIKEVNKK